MSSHAIMLGLVTLLIDPTLLLHLKGNELLLNLTNAFCLKVELLEGYHVHFVLALVIS